MAARVAETRETRRPPERPTPEAAADLLRGGPFGDFFRDENENENENAFAFGAPRVARGDAEPPIRVRLAAMSARLDAGGFGVPIGEPGFARLAGKPGAETKFRATKAKRKTKKKPKRTGKNAGRPDPFDVLAMPRRRAASSEPARPRPLRANPVPMSNYFPPGTVPRDVFYDGDVRLGRRGSQTRPPSPPSLGAFASASQRARAREAEAMEATEERLAAVRIRREALAAARRYAATS